MSHVDTTTAHISAEDGQEIVVSRAEDGQQIVVIDGDCAIPVVGELSTSTTPADFREFERLAREWYERDQIDTPQPA